MTEADTRLPQLTARQVIEHLVLQEHVSFASRQTQRHLEQLITDLIEKMTFEALIDQLKTKILQIKIDRRELLRQPNRNDIQEEIAVFTADLQSLLLQILNFLAGYGINVSEFKDTSVKILDPYLLPPP